MVEDGDGRLKGQGGPTQDDRDKGAEGVVRSPGNWLLKLAVGRGPGGMSRSRKENGGLHGRQPEVVQQESSRAQLERRQGW